ncbi:hypothetical protein Ancab_013591 [Ancistrocladus abbreviatus]
MTQAFPVSLGGKMHRSLQGCSFCKDGHCIGSPSPKSSSTTAAPPPPPLIVPPIDPIAQISPQPKNDKQNKTLEISVFHNHTTQKMKNQSRVSKIVIKLSLASWR